MKKVFLLATALAALVSCTSDDFVGENNSPNPNPAPDAGEKAIVFNSGAKTVTRAEHTGADAAGMLNNNFVFAGTKSDGTNAPTTFVFDQYNANYVASTANTTESNSNDWEYVGYIPNGYSTLPSGATQSIKYWDYSTKQYDFAAYSLGKGYTTTGESPSTSYATASAIAAGNKSYTLSGSAEELKACYISDLVTAYNRDSETDYGNVVTFSFRSLAAKIRLAFYETVPGYSVKDVKFYESGSATGTTSGGETPVENGPTLYAASGSSVLPSGNGTMTISFPTTGWDNKSATDYNKAHIAFSGTTSTKMSLDALGDLAGAEKQEAAGNYYIGRASNEATYAGGLVSGNGKYYTLLPYETGTNLTLRIKYTLVSTDGSNEEITVDKATAVIPAELAKWSPNYAYTYIFKISDMTNGTTGVDGDGNPVYGLTPITLNAVVVDSEDGIQETITTVASPSITTYTKGKVVTINNEYSTGANIYVIVNDGTSNVALTAGTNAKLYTVTIENGAAQDINEASVANALQNGAQATVGDVKTYTVTDAKGKKLVVTEASGLSAITEIAAADSPTGSAITVDGAMFNPAAAGTYVFQYLPEATSAEFYQEGDEIPAGKQIGDVKTEATYKDAKDCKYKIIIVQ